MFCLEWKLTQPTVNPRWALKVLHLRFTHSFFENVPLSILALFNLTCLPVEIACARGLMWGVSALISAQVEEVVEPVWARPAACYRQITHIWQPGCLPSSWTESRSQGLSGMFRLPLCMLGSHSPFAKALRGGREANHTTSLPQTKGLLQLDLSLELPPPPFTKLQRYVVGVTSD